MRFFIAHAPNGTISTSGLKSDVTIVFLDADFLSDVEISAIRVHLRQIWDDIIFHGFSGPLGLKWFFLGVGDKIGEGVRRYWPSTNSFLLLGVLTSVPIFGERQIDPHERNLCIFSTTEVNLPLIMRLLLIFHYH